MDKLDFTQLTEEEKKAIVGDLNLTQDAIKQILNQTAQILKSITKGHEETTKALQNPIIFTAFVEQLTAQDLRTEGITEKSIADFLNSSTEEKKEAIDSLDIFIVYRLFEAKNITAPALDNDTETQTGYRGLHRIREELIKQVAPRESLTPYTPLKKTGLKLDIERIAEQNNPFSGLTTDELRELIVTIDYGEES